MASTLPWQSFMISLMCSGIIHSNCVLFLSLSLARMFLFLSFFFLMIPRPPRSPLFPYTTLFRSTLSLHDALPIWPDAGVRGTCVARVAGSPQSLYRRTSCLLAVGSPWIARLRRDRWSRARTSSRRQARSEEHTSELQSHSDLVCR